MKLLKGWKYSEKTCTWYKSGLKNKNGVWKFRRKSVALISNQ